MLSFEEAASRRDFTINAISWDPLTEVVIDPFEGVKDLNARILRHVSEKFSEDPLRVLRAMQFVARFELSVAPETLELCRSLTIEGISKERIYEEFKKLVVMGKKPSMGLQFLKDCGWIKYFPELSQLIDCQQDPEKHPEGDVWTHTLLALDAFAQARTGVEWEDLVVGLAVLCHDLGKPQATTVDERGAIHALGHETVGVDVALNFLQRITSHKKLMDGVLELVGMHMYPAALFRDREKIRDATMRRFLRKVEHVDRLCRVVEADMAGKRSSGMPITSWLKDRIASLPAGLESPLVKGKHLISLGLPPGPIFKKILDDCFAAQIDGKFSTIKEGIEYLRKLFFSREKKKFPNLQKKSDIGRHFLGT
jgi:tRNA nucleotidyltransferase (CCA-adding enzyme)